MMMAEELISPFKPGGKKKEAAKPQKPVPAEPVQDETSARA